ncbi:MAG: sulfite exporter TauE/SafE family protein [Desulfovibrionaceae bacterium]|nr:sulfite exporter TauE/SafE family protein [Desulfovibrionaceae bacterium]
MSNNTGGSNKVMSLIDALWFVLGWFLGGFVYAIAGFGSSLVAIPLVTQGMDITLAVPACSLMVLVTSLEQGWRYKGHADWRRIRPVLVGAFPGAIIGFLVLRYLPPQHLKAALGVFLITYACWGLFLEGGKARIISGIWGYAAGLLSTMFGSAFSFNGPPLAVYTSLSGWGKDVSKAGLAMTFIVTSSLMVLAQIFAGAHNSITLTAMLIGTPAAIFGSRLGFLASRSMGDKTYRKLLFGFIGCNGLIFFRQAAYILL